MSESGEVNWNHLPHNPQAFFGLGESYERRDLKRAYGKLIRRFKPETHPGEFQRIRAAYEELESHLRYGESRQTTFNADQAWDFRSPQPNAVNQSFADPSDRINRTSGQSEPQTVIELAIADPETTYHAMARKVDLTPQEYYVLAVLSDLVQPQKAPSQFLIHLLAGLEKHPTDAGLQSLVQQHLRNDVSLDVAEEILQQVATVTRSAVFYRITESLWERLLREQDFSVFRELLERCETKLRQTDATSRNVFYTRILRTAVWKANSEWVQERIDELESQASTMQPFLLQELEFVATLRDYLTLTSVSLRNYAARKRLQRILYLYCTSDGPAATAKITAELSQVAREATSMRSAFPVLSDVDDTPLYMLMYLISDDLQQTTGLGFGEINDQQNNILARTLLDDLKPSQQTIINAMNTINFQYRWLPFIAGITLSIVFTSICITIGDINSRVDKQASGIVGICTPIVFIIGYFAWIFPKMLHPRLDRAQGERWWQLYEQHWRERIFRYVQSCSEPPADAFNRVVSMGRIVRQEDWAGLVQRFATNDIGLLIFSQTQAFVV